MSDMTMDQAREARQKAEDQILSIVRGFEEASGAKVDAIDVFGTEFACIERERNVRLTTRVKLRAEL